MFSTYILYSDKLKKHYIGSTKNIQSRLKNHNSGKVIFTKRGIPWKLLYKEDYYQRNEAYSREQEIKSYKGGIQFKILLQRYSGGIA